MISNPNILKKYSIQISESYPYPFSLVRVELDSDKNPVDWTFLYCNDALAKLYSLSKEEMIDHLYSEVKPKGSKKWLRYFYESAYKDKFFSFDEISEEMNVYLFVEVFPTDEEGVCACVIKDIKDDVASKVKRNEELEETIHALEEERRINEQVQLYASSMGVVYPLAISLDYLKNEYHMLEYENFLNKTAKWSGTIDELIDAGASTIPDEKYAERFKNLFGREPSLEAFKQGEKELTLKHPQIGDDGKIHWMETKVICLECTDEKAEAISIAKCIDEEKIIDDAIKEQEQQKRILEEQLEVVDVLSRNFRNIYLINLKERQAKVLKCDDKYVEKQLRQFEGMFFPYEEIFQQWIDMAVYEEDRQMLKEELDPDHLLEVLKSNEEYVGNYRYIDDEEIENYQFNIVKMRGNNVIAGFQKIDEIIQEHLDQERKQREIEEKYQKQLEEQVMIFNTLSRNFKNIYLVDLKKGTARILKLEANYVDVPGKTDHHEFPFDAILDRWISTGVYIDDQDMMRETLNTENVKNLLLKNNECVGNYRSVVNGEIHHFQYNLSKTDQEDIVILGFQNIDSIIQEHLEQERKQREIEEAHKKELANYYERLNEMHDMFVASGMGTWSITMVEGKEPTMYADELMMELLGIGGQKLTPEEVYRAWFDNIVPEALQTVLDSVEKMKKGARDENTYLWKHPLLGERYVRCGGAAKQVEGGYILSGYHYDVDDYIREQKKQEQALKDAYMVAQHATRAKTTFLSNMSHDIRTPMNAIIGYTALAQTHLEGNEQVKDYLNKIHTSSTHLLSLINEILDMSRIESGTVKLEENAVHIPDVLHDLRTMIQGQVAAKQQNLYIDTLDVIHEDVITDKLRLNQVLLNIVSNAIKYTGIGGDIIVRVTEKPCSIKDRTTYEFDIKDNGEGMSKDFVEHVFDSFSRERTSTVSGIQGTGLGMSITKSIVDMMNGTITVESELNKGSEFVVTLDFKLADAPVDYSPIPELMGARALVVDDDVNTCQSVSKMLREIDMRPDWSTSGKEAIIRAKEATEIKDEYKVFIIDYLMPDMNGIEVVRRIRRVIGDEIPIIVLTAYDWTEFEDEARKAGVTAFVAKPIFMSELRSVLTKSDEEEVVETKTYDYSGLHVLLVEDNELNREIATSLLEEVGVEVDQATDGTEAVNIIYRSDADKYDLIFMDVQMPKMDGYTATKEIRTLENNTKANIPIVAMTANAFEEDKKKAIEAGMNGHIAKPISIEAISEVLDKIFNK